MMARVRKSLDENQKGFTLVELLVVIIIIGILAAIAIPVYLGQQGKASDSAAKADLANAKTAVVIKSVEDAAYDPADGAVVPNFTPSGTTTDMKIAKFTKPSSTSNGSFCIQATSSKTSTTFYVTQDGGITTTAPTVCI